MECVLGCHAADVLHLDVKPDNFLVRAGAPFDAAGGGVAERIGRAGWGLVLADFGRALDRRAHPGATFRTAKDRAHLAEYEWPPARADAPWSTELDTYALGVCLHLVCRGCLPRRHRVSRY